MVVEIRDTEVLGAYFRADPFLHLYALGDLDEFFRPNARWWGLFDEAGESRPGPREVVLFYDAGTVPVLLAFTREPAAMRTLVSGIREHLPDRFYAHFSPGVEEALGSEYRLAPHGEHLRMGLIDESRLTAVSPGEVKAGSRSAGNVRVSALSGAELPGLLDLYAASYPENWFDPRMLETGQYLGAWIDGVLCAAAGVHVYSTSYRVAALGNIATRPEYRGRGLAGMVTGALCRQLRSGVDWIGLNVHAGNAAAISCYRRLGFARVADYGEFMVERA